MNSPLRHFSEIYCERHGLLPEQFASHIRKKVLYPQARLFVPLLSLFNSDCLAADNDFIQDVARLTRYRDFSDSSFLYIHHPSNRGFLRRSLRLRVSTERMRRLVRKTLGTQAETSGGVHDGTPNG